MSGSILFCPALLSTRMPWASSLLLVAHIRAPPLITPVVRWPYSRYKVQSHEVTCVWWGHGPLEPPLNRTSPVSLFEAIIFVYRDWLAYASAPIPERSAVALLCNSWWKDLALPSKYSLQCSNSSRLVTLNLCRIQNSWISWRIVIMLWWERYKGGFMPITWKHFEPMFQSSIFSRLPEVFFFYRRNTFSTYDFE